MAKTLAFGFWAAVFACFATPDLSWARPIGADQIANCRVTSARYANLSFDERMEAAIGTFGRNIAHPQSADFLRFARETRYQQKGVSMCH
jgi:hypothetical protein